MNCPNCTSELKSIQYEGITIETCPGCGGEWLDADELGHIVRIREVRFSDEERRAIDATAKIPGIPSQEIERDVTCPKCGNATGPINYGADTGIIIDRCGQCHGIWLDADELEKIQMLIETWKDNLPEDLKKYGPHLRKIAVELDRADDVTLSRLPIVGSYINAVVNGILDVIG